MYQVEKCCSCSLIYTNTHIQTGKYKKIKYISSSWSASNSLLVPDRARDRRGANKTMCVYMLLYIERMHAEAKTAYKKRDLVGRKREHVLPLQLSHHQLTLYHHDPLPSSMYMYSTLFSPASCHISFLAS